MTNIDNPLAKRHAAIDKAQADYALASKAFGAAVAAARQAYNEATGGRGII